MRFHGIIYYCAFDIFQKVIFCLALYTEEVSLQIFVMLLCKIICRNYICTKKIILVIGFKKIKYFHFFP